MSLGIKSHELVSATSSCLSEKKGLQCTVSHGVACVAHLEHGVAVLLTTKLRGLNKSYTRNVVDYSCAISGAEPISRNLKTLSDEVPV
jgi:hypothetical protein